MLHSPRRWGFVTAAFLCVASVAAAQTNKIPYEIVTATSALSGAQRQEIDRYAQDMIARLTFGTLNEAVQARKDLIEPMSWAGSSDIFHLAYSSAVSGRLSQAIGSEQVHVRLNAMIVVGSLRDPGTVGLIQKGLADPTPAVRYWAGKAISQVGVQASLSETEQRTLLRALTSAMETETSERVLQRLLVGLVGLNIPEADAQLLSALNRRVDLHADNSSLSLEAEMEGLRTLFVKFVQARSNSQTVPAQTVQQLTLVAYRYFILSATLLDSGRLNQDSFAQYPKMLQITDTILGWAVSQMPPSGPPPAPIKNELANQNWQLIHLRAEEWKRTLSLAPFNFEPVALMVTIPDP